MRPKTTKPVPTLAPRHLANEAATVQFPLVRHASDVGWTVVSKEDALRKRGGEQGFFFYDELRDALLRLNPGLVSADNVQSIISRMEGVRPSIEGNREILEWLRNQRTVFDETEKRHRNVTVIDYEHPENDRFHVTYEWTSRAPGRKGNRADIIFLINGVPVAIVENKNPDKRDALTRAVTQLRRYELETPELMVMPQVFNVTHLIEYYYGVTWNYARKAVFKWKVEPSETYREAVHSFFRIPHFLELLREWLLFYVKDDELQKTVLQLIVLDVEQEPLPQQLEEVRDTEEAVDRLSVGLGRLDLPFEDGLAGVVPGDAVVVLDEVGDVEHLGHHHQLRRVDFVAAQLGDGAGQGIAFVGILVLDDGDRDAVNKEDDVGAVAFAAGSPRSPLIGDVEAIVLRVLVVDHRNVAVPLFSLVEHRALIAQPFEDLAITLDARADPLHSADNGLDVVG